MDTRIILVTLTFQHKDLHLVLPRGGDQLSSTLMSRAEPDSHAKEIAETVCGSTSNVERQGFFSANEAEYDELVLLYSQLISEEQLNQDGKRDIELVPVDAVSTQLCARDSSLVSTLVQKLRSDLRQVMHSRLHKLGLIHLLNVLPEIFDHKELAAAFQAFAGEKPTSPLMLARMMLNSYSIGSGDKQREVRGRDLIQEYKSDEPDLLDQKWNKNKELYRTGGPKAKRLYKKNQRT